MRLLASGAAIAALVLAAAIPPIPAHAAQPPRVEGGDCNYLAAQFGPSKVWRTDFRGSRPSPFDLRHQDYWPYSASPCFKSQAACKAWLYWAQSDYPYQNNFTPCRRLG
jgi:hypothetical protein